MHQFNRAWHVVVRSQVLSLRSALKLLSLVAFVAGITRINFTILITSEKKDFSVLFNDLS